MVGERAMQGDYADLRIVKGRKVVTMMVEFPLEQFSQLVEMFGGPQPDSNVPVAVARLQGAVGDNPAPAPKKPLAPSQRAAVLCKDEAFQRWLSRNDDVPRPAVLNNDWDEWATTEVRHHCGVHSRSLLDTDETARLKFEGLESEFLQATGRMARDR